MVHDPQIGQALRGQREVGRIWKVHEGSMKVPCLEAKFVNYQHLWGKAMAFDFLKLTFWQPNLVERSPEIWEKRGLLWILLWIKELTNIKTSVGWRVQSDSEETLDVGHESAVYIMLATPFVVLKNASGDIGDMCPFCSELETWNQLLSMFDRVEII